MNNSKGQGLIEYLMLVCLIAVSAVAVVSIVGQNVKELYANISMALSNKSKVKLSTPDKSAYQARGLDDFHESARPPK